MISLLDTSDRFALAIPAEMLQDARLSARERANITPRASTTEIITDVAHTLPFDKLSPRDFERLCLWLVEREGYERAELLGAAGSEQGRDIVAWREGRLWAFQCKRVKHFGSKSAFLEVDMVLSLSKDRPPAGLIFLVTCDVSDSTRQQVRQRCAGEIECHFWGRTELDEKIRRHADIVEEFFSPRIHLSGSPFQAPPLPLHFVPRSEISEALKARLLTDESSAPGVLVVSSIHGLGGIGKSTLAAALAHDRETQVRFPDGVLWAPLGQRPEILSALESWIRALGDYDFHPATVNAASAHLRSLLYGRAAMLVVDDVRQADHARPFLVGGARCRVLVTTRDALVAQALSGMVYHLDVMTPEQSLDLLSARLGRTLDDVEREEALKLAKAVGYLPLALELAAAQVASGMHWAELRRTLENEMKQPQAQTPSSGDQPHVYSKEMVRVPAGLFLYGNDKRRVDVHEFWIDKALVTNAEYARFVAATGHKPPSHWRGKVPLQELAEHPVIQVSWHDAVAYGEWAGKRLPTEEEWEKAARGTDGRIYPWGDEPPDEGRCNFGGNVGSTTPVGRYSPQGDSPYGCSDMAGNVWEWTASDYDAGRKVLRGGSWDNEPLHVRAAYRIANTPGSRGNVMGFRCVRSSE
jgi:formylglycine-generating enzyme required for sulfatase activity